MKNNRNAWNAAEVETLITTVQSSKKPSIGCKKAANILGRTALACSCKYYQYIRDTKGSNTKPSIKLTNSEPIVQGSMTLSFKIKSAKISNDYLTIEI